jgi:hypothetical protein
MQSSALFLNESGYELDFGLKNGINFINGILNKPFQENTFEENRKKISIKDYNQEELFSFYTLDLVKDEIISLEYHLKQSGTFIKKAKSLQNGEWKEISLDNELILRCGSWRRGFDRYRLMDKKTFYLDDIYKFEILESKDISGVHSIKGKNFSIPRGGRFYTIKATQKKDIFRLNKIVEEIDLLKFIKKYSKLECFEKFGYGGISFGSVYSGQREGKLWYFNRVNGQIILVLDDAGSWRIENIDGVDILIVEIKEHDPIIFTNIGSTLYSGRISKATIKSWNAYNKIAFDALKNLLY